MSSLTPTIIPRPEHSISRKWISPNALRVLYRLKEKGYLAYLVGGGVRDLLLGREPKDFDVATDATPGEIKKIFRNCRLIGRRFRLAHIHFHDEIIEVATFRSSTADEAEAAGAAPEVDRLPARPIEPGTTEAPLPAAAEGPAAAAPEGQTIEAPSRPRPPRMLKTEEGMILRDNVFGTPEEDALRRDFTVNALFYNIADYSVIDYVGGMEDLRQGLIRIIGDPAVRFIEDPVRMVRAVRFAAMLGFEIEENTYRALIELRDRVALASPARLYEEVLKLFLLGEGEKTYRLLRQTGLFGALFPQLNDWVDTEADGFPHIWIGKALEWADTYVQSGRQVAPHVLFALMFGQYIEEKAAAIRKTGVPPFEALNKAAGEFFSEQSRRVLISKRVSLPMRDIYWNQQRFERREGKYSRYFLRRPGFADAFEYLRFTSEVTGEKRELRAWWKDFIKNHPAEPARAKEEQKGRKPNRRAGRRRGGRRKGKLEQRNPGTGKSEK